MKVGDLVKVKDDPENRCGMGIVYDRNGGFQVKVHWFWEHMNGPNYDEWLRIIYLEDINEQQKDA